jgi:hypothetical protein
MMDISATVWRLAGLFASGVIFRYVATTLYADVDVGIETIAGFGFFIGLLVYGLGYYYIGYHACKGKSRSWEMTSEFVSKQEHELHEMEAEQQQKKQETSEKQHGRKE